MSRTAARRIAVVGAGIAGLTAALAFAARGLDVAIFDRASTLEEAGAGLQLSPNATRLLDRLGALDALRPLAVQPDAVVLRDGATLRELARVPLGDAAERRWRAPYLVAHRADLQQALLHRVKQESRISLALAAPVSAATIDDGRLSVLIEGSDRARVESCDFLVGADGVHSAVRHLLPGARRKVSAAEIAWRTTVAAGSTAGGILAGAVSPRVVTAFLRPGFHLVAYPVRAGGEINLVAFTKAKSGAPAGNGGAARVMLDRELARCAPPLRRLAESRPDWTCWPLHTVDPAPPWTDGRSVALIGDAAHAMTPYAAQGAAMAIEDAVTLAGAFPAGAAGAKAALAAWERERRARVTRVLRRAALNRFAWHAAGPVALARNLVLSARGSERLAADMDWLYGWDPAPAG